MGWGPELTQEGLGTPGAGLGSRGRGWDLGGGAGWGGEGPGTGSRGRGWDPGGGAGGAQGRGWDPGGGAGCPAHMAVWRRSENTRSVKSASSPARAALGTTR